MSQVVKCASGISLTMDFVENRMRYLAIRRRQRVQWVQRPLRDLDDPLAFPDPDLFKRYRFRRPTLVFLVMLLDVSLSRFVCLFVGLV